MHVAKCDLLLVAGTATEKGEGNVTAASQIFPNFFFFRFCHFPSLMLSKQLFSKLKSFPDYLYCLYSRDELSGSPGSAPTGAVITHWP